MTPVDLRYAKARALLDALALMGYPIRREADRLVVTAPRDQLTADDRRELAAYKPELLELLDLLV